MNTAPFVAPAVSAGPAIAPRSLLDQTTRLLRSVRESYEIARELFLRSCDEGWTYEAHAEAKASMERAAALLEEALYEAQIVAQMPLSAVNVKHALRAVSP